LYHFPRFALAPRFPALFTVSYVLPRLEAEVKLSLGFDWFFSYYDYYYDYESLVTRGPFLESPVNFSVLDTDGLKMALRARKVSGAFKKHAPGFNVQLVSLSRAPGFVSSGNLSAFDIIDRKAREIACDNNTTTGNEESCVWQHRNFKSKTSSPKLRRALPN